MRKKHFTAFPTQANLEAACRIHDRVQRWVLTDVLFNEVKRKFRGFEYQYSLLKCALVNSVYSTNVRALTSMAQHVSNVLLSPNRPPARQLVCAIANAQGLAGNRRFPSFASKFCHLFVDSTLPIYDSVAMAMLKRYLGKSYLDPKKAREPYTEFCIDFDAFCQQAKFNASVRQIDHFLWVSGSYLKWTQKRTKNKRINSELEKAFRKLKLERSPDLSMLI